MKPQTFSTVVAMLMLVALLMTSGSGVVAQGPLPPQGSQQMPGNTGGVEPVAPHGDAPQSPEAVAANVNADGTFTYQGQLKLNGNLYDGNCDFSFGIYDAATSGTMVAGPYTTPNITVTKGLFSAPVNYWNWGPQRWIEIGVSCPHSASPSYTTLSPRQKITAAPYANSLRPGSDTLYSDSAGNFISEAYIAYGSIAGLYGVSYYTGTAGVYGYTSANANTPGVKGISGQTGTSRGNTGVLGLDSRGTVANAHPSGAFYDAAGTFSGPNGVIGAASSDAGDGYGVIGVTTGTAGVGVYGWSLASTGTNYGVYGISNSSSGTGVYGSAPLYGVYGSSSNYGVYGTTASSGATGVYGYASNDITTTTTSGVYGYTESGAGFGGRFIANNNIGQDVGVYGRADGDGISSNYASWGVVGHHYYSGVGVGAWSYYGNIIEGYSGDFPSTTNRRLYLTNAGELYIHGNIHTYAATSAAESGAEYRALTAIQSAEVWYEDFGTATLVNGKVVVTIEPVFAKTVDTSIDYHVYVTPLCDEAVLLFVSAKTAQGFTVQGVTLDGKASQCAFDYRIVAKPVGQANTRLPVVGGPVKANDPAPAPRPAKSEPPNSAPSLPAPPPAAGLPEQGH